MRIIFQQGCHHDDKGRPKNSSEFGPLPPERVDRISPLPKMALVRAPNTDTFLHIVPSVVSASTGVLVKIA
jgi:hypothetical protein